MESTHLEAILDLFNRLDDPRQPGKIKYPISEILLLVLCASICGSNSITEIVEFGELIIDFLQQLLPYKNGIPSHNTIARLLSLIDCTQFCHSFVNWTNNILQSIPKLIAIDGKTQLRTTNGEIPAAHIVSAFAAKEKLVIGQLKTDKKSNEIITIP